MRLWLPLLGLLLPLQPAISHADTPGPKILFLGSSTMFFWSHTGTLSGDFYRFQPVNLGVGGTDYKFLNENADAWAAEHPDATQVVIYSGDNDIANGDTPEQVAQNFRRLAEKLHAKLPFAELHVVSVKPTLAPDRVDKLAVVDRANEELEVRAKQLGYVNFIDVNTPMYGRDGQPRREMLGPDLLHMSRRGYRLWRDFVWPSVSRCEEQQPAMARFMDNPPEIYQLTSRTPATYSVPGQAKTVLGKIAAAVARACEGQVRLAAVAERAAVLRHGEGQAGKFENGSALVLDTLEKIRLFREAVQKDYREASGEARRFGAWGYSQATNAKGKPEEQAQLRREAFSGRRLTAQAARKLLSVDFELSRQAARLSALGAEFLERWEKLGEPAASAKLQTAKAGLEQQKAERQRQDTGRIELHRH